MVQKSSDLVIIGGGLTGLCLAYYLRQRNIAVTIIEARERLGGRIYTLRNQNIAPIDMGATWFGKKHAALSALLEELEIGHFEQILGEQAVYEPISTSPPQLVQLPPNNYPSFRIENGSSHLIEKLASKLKNTDIYINQTVKSITEKSTDVVVQTSDYQFVTKAVVSTLPPNLLANTIEVTPSFPSQFEALLKSTHTWMGESIKVSLTFEKPFWNAEKLSGTIFSNVGPIPEMYDHSDINNQTYALTGFLNGAYFSMEKSDRLELILTQLRKYFGELVDSYLSYEEMIWRKEDYTFVPYDTHVLPHQNNGNVQFQQTFFGGKLFIAGSETAPMYPGYMDGAVRSAQLIFDKIQEHL